MKPNQDNITDQNTKLQNPRKPSFLVIGVQKAATSWLWVQLKKHPLIWMPPVKELHYFDHRFVAENKNWTRPHIVKGVMQALRWQVNNVYPPNPSYLRYLVNLMGEDMFTEKWYLRAFDRPTKENVLLGDVTPEYCTIPEEGVSYVKTLLPNTKIVMVVRDPVARAESQLRMNISRRGIESAKISADEWDSLSNESAIYNRAQYDEYIPTWEKFYGDIHYIPYKKIATAPKEVMAQLFEFLELPAEEIEGLEDKVHVGAPSKIPRAISLKFNKIFESQYSFLNDKFDQSFIDFI